MIKSILIENFILTDRLEVEFSNGLQVLSGETGAGKSVIIGAVNYLFGDKIVSDVVFDKKKASFLEAVFDIENVTTETYEFLKEIGVDKKDEELIIRREIFADRSSKSFINGRRVAISLIKELRERVLDFHSQREQVKLFDHNYQLLILDTYANLIPDRDNFSKEYKNLHKLIKIRDNMIQEDEKLADKFKLYQYQIEEIELINPLPEEELQLKNDLDIMTHSEDILNTVAEIQHNFYEKEKSFLDVTSQYQQKMERYSKDSKINAVSSMLASAVQIFKDMQAELRNVSESVDIDSQQMTVVENRLNTLIELKNKYQRTCPQILEYLREMKSEIANIRSRKDEIDELEKKISKSLEGLRTSGIQLSLDRKKASQYFSKEIVENMRKLAIPDGSFDVGFMLAENLNEREETYLKSINETGIDRISFMFSANKGIDVQMLQNAVSGGELSRLLLVIKKILAGKLDTMALIFDEIDTGIGGNTANRLGEFISDVSKYHQVICITHLAQIASFADKHFLIEKVSSVKNSLIRISELYGKERTKELARMLSGSDSDSALNHAEELLNRM